MFIKLEALLLAMTICMLAMIKKNVNGLNFFYIIYILLWYVNISVEILVGRSYLNFRAIKKHG